MAVTDTFRVDVRPYSGYDDPALPIGAWVAQGGSVGDASGGDLFMSFFFTIDDDNQVSELYNLEQVAIDTSNETSGNEQGMMDVLNMDQLAFNRPLTDARYSFLLQDTLAGFGVALRDIFPPLPIWLGAPSRQEGGSGLRFQFDNLDLQLYSIIIQGYIWGPRSVLAPGGPRRPVGGLFGKG